MSVLRHRNPIHPGYFADPFVWRSGDAYFAIGTGAGEDVGTGGGLNRVFRLLRSDDFVTWRPIGDALERPAPGLGNSFWAPEIAFAQGTYHLYYSVGWGDRAHQLRVAVSQTPAGPYRDTGRSLLDSLVTPFAIDPHPFRDHDGRWYLFYARDFLDGERPGTALAVRRLVAMDQLADEEVVVLRAHHDWQRFERDRKIHGGVFDWHTLEGPAVFAHDGQYYCFYSGGRWEGAGYGVDYAVAKSVLGPYDDRGGADGPRVLRSVPGRVLGPGHNSIVMGPDGVTVYFAYHAWDHELTARRMFLDPIVWSASGPRCLGPTLG